MSKKSSGKKVADQKKASARPGKTELTSDRSKAQAKLAELISVLANDALHAAKVTKEVKKSPTKRPPRIEVRASGVHGKGVFALVPIPKGETLIEYEGQMITWKQALKQHPHDPNDPNHTFYFHIDDKHVIDGNVGGNASRWINHSCKPNCEADQQGKQVFIKSIKNIKAGEELFYNYGLVIDGKLTKKLKREYACWCGNKKCIGTMLSASM